MQGLLVVIGCTEENRLNVRARARACVPLQSVTYVFRPVTETLSRGLPASDPSPQSRREQVPVAWFVNCLLYLAAFHIASVGEFGSSAFGSQLSAKGQAFLWVSENCCGWAGGRKGRVCRM